MDGPRETARFWRLNSIDALQITPRVETWHELFARDPEHLVKLQKNSADYSAHVVRENTVRRRFNAIHKRDLPLLNP